MLLIVAVIPTFESPPGNTDHQNFDKLFEILRTADNNCRYKYYQNNDQQFNNSRDGNIAEPSLSIVVYLQRKISPIV